MAYWRLLLTAGLMCRDTNGEKTTTLARRLGERGDLVAVKTADIGSAITAGHLSECDVEELREALTEIDELLAQVEQDPGFSTGQGSASAD